MNQSKGLLLLSHCGFSFMEDLVKAVQQLGMESFVLSSLPINHEKRFGELQTLTPNVTLIQNPVLSWEIVADHIHYLQASNTTILACISVWEGYREIMAKANQMLRSHDIADDKINLLRDKYTFRKTLQEKELSLANVDIATENLLTQYQQERRPKFIKPRFGIASYATFALNEHVTMQQLEALRSDMKEDYEYAALLNSHQDFIIEDFIAGKEFSFEVLVYAGTPYVIAIHEKIDVELSQAAILENACIAPPMHFSPDTYQTATLWIEKLFQAFAIDFGCYHVEAKLQNQAWEAIEINPRVGGAYIAKSVEILSGESLLVMWLKSLIATETADVQAMKHYLHSISTQNSAFYAREHKTFFRVFFANAMHSIKNISVNNQVQPPFEFKILLQPGAKILTHAREMFLGQALWKLTAETHDEIQHLITTSKHLLEVIYE